MYIVICIDLHTGYFYVQMMLHSSTVLVLTVEVLAMTPILDVAAQLSGMSRWAIVEHRRQRPTFLSSTSRAAVFPLAFRRMRVAFACTTEARGSVPTWDSDKGGGGRVGPDGGGVEGARTGGGEEPATTNETKAKGTTTKT